MTLCTTEILENDGEFSNVMFKLDDWNAVDRYYLSSTFNAYGTGSMIFTKGRLSVRLQNRNYRYVVRKNQYDVVCRGLLKIPQKGDYYHSQERRSFYDYFDGYFFIRIRAPSTTRSITIKSAGQKFKMFRGGRSHGYSYFQAQISESLCGKQYSFYNASYGAGKIPGTYRLRKVKCLRPEWVSRSVFYQIFTDRFNRSDRCEYQTSETVPWNSPPEQGLFFGGNLKGIEERLGYLKELGITSLYLTPVFEARTEHRYDTQDYFKIDPMLGKNRDIASLISSCHKKSMRVVLDAVFNHTGTSFHEFYPFLNGREGWYIGHGRREIYRGRYDMKKRAGMKPSYETWEGVGSLPKLNLSNPVVREYLLSVLSYWTGYAKVDGWRFDVGESLPLDFLLKARRLLRSINPDCYLLGEMWKNPSFWLEDAFYDATMNYVFREAVLLFAEQKIGVSSFINRVYDVYAHIPLSASVSQYNLLGSHDTSRIATVLSSNKKKIALVLAILFSLPGAPAIYYGDEFMMKGAGGDNARGTVDWSSEQTFSRLISSLCLLRSKNRELCSGIFEANCRNGSLVIRRSIGPHSVIFVCCNAGGNRSIDVEGIEIISSGAEVKGSRIVLKPFGWIFLRHR